MIRMNTIFGPDGETVRHFRTSEHAIALRRVLADDRSERDRLAFAVKARARRGTNTYGDRLASMQTPRTRFVAGVRSRGWAHD